MPNYICTKKCTVACLHQTKHKHQPDCDIGGGLLDCEKCIPIELNVCNGCDWASRKVIPTQNGLVIKFDWSCNKNNGAVVQRWKDKNDLIYRPEWCCLNDIKEQPVTRRVRKRICLRD